MDTLMRPEQAVMDPGLLKLKARVFAMNAHDATGQVRKYTGQSFFVHPNQVANLVKTVKHTPEMVAAAYLHDTIEDCGVTSEQIHAEFGHAVGNLVDWLTDKSSPQDGNRAARKAIDHAHRAKAPPAAKTIMLADIIDNASTIREHDPDFWKVWRVEKLALLEVIKQGDQTLWNRAKAECEQE